MKRHTSRLWLAAALAVGALGAPNATYAQSLQELRGRYVLPVPEYDGILEPRYRWTLPSMGANTPSGFGADWGDLYVGMSYQARTRFLQQDDGSVGFGLGLGDARRAVGLRVSVVSFSTVRSGFGERVGVDLHLHRRLPANFAVAVGWENAIRRGITDSGRSKYAVLSRFFRVRDDVRKPFSLVVLSVGVGNERFQSEDAFRAGEGGIGVFGSAAVRLAAPVSLIANWTGQDLLLAGSVAPLRNHGLVITAGLADVVGTAGDGAPFVIGGGFRFDLSQQAAVRREMKAEFEEYKDDDAVGAIKPQKVLWPERLRSAALRADQARAREPSPPLARDGRGRLHRLESR